MDNNNNDQHPTPGAGPSGTSGSTGSNASNGSSGSGESRRATDPLRNRQPISTMSFFLPFPRPPRSGPGGEPSSGSEGEAAAEGETGAVEGAEGGDQVRHGLTWTIEVFTGDEPVPTPQHTVTGSPLPTEQELRQEPGPIPTPTSTNTTPTPTTTSASTTHPSPNPPATEGGANPTPNSNTPLESRSFTFVLGPDGRVLFSTGGPSAPGSTPDGLGLGVGTPGSDPNAGSDSPFFLFPFAPFGGGFTSRPPRPDPEKAAELLRSLPTVERELMQRIEKIVVAESEAEGEDGWRCPICLDGVENEQGETGVKGLPCNHLFHESCLQQWFATKHTWYDLDPLKTLRPSARRFARPRATGAPPTAPTAHPYARPASAARQPSNESITDTPLHASPQPIDVEMLLRPLLSPPVATQDLPADPPAPSAAQLFASSSTQQPVFTAPSLPQIIRTPLQPQPQSTPTTETQAPRATSEPPSTSTHSTSSSAIPPRAATPSTTTSTDPQPSLAAPTPLRPPFLPRPIRRGGHFSIPNPGPGPTHIPFPLFFPSFFSAAAQDNRVPEPGTAPAPANGIDRTPAEAPAPPARPVQSLESWTLQRERSLGWKCDAVDCADSGKMTGIYSPLQKNLPKASGKRKRAQDDEAGREEESKGDGQVEAQSRSEGEEGEEEENEFVILACEHRWHKGCLEEAERIAGRPMRVEDGKMWVKCDRCRKDGWVAAEPIVSGARDATDAEQETQTQTGEGLAA